MASGAQPMSHHLPEPAKTHATPSGINKSPDIRSVFAYGSWIWKPEFHYKSLSVGVAFGFSRQLYQGSQDDYGTPSWPGRIATIVPCPSSGVVGCIYRLSKRYKERDLASMETRQTSLGFYKSELSVENCSTGKAEDCWVFVARQGPDNPYWLGKAEPNVIAFQVVQARGRLGENLDYVKRLVDFVRLQTRGVVDRDLDTKRILKLALAETEEPDSQHHHHPHHLHQQQQQRHHQKHDHEIGAPASPDDKSTVFLVREEMRSQLLGGGANATYRERETDAKDAKKEKAKRLDKKKQKKLDKKKDKHAHKK